MQYKIKISKIKEFLPFILVAWVIVCSGSQHFRIYNSFPTHMLLLLLTAIFFLMKKRISRDNFIRIGIIGIFLCTHIFIGVFVNGFSFRLNDFIIFCISCCTLTVLQSNMEGRDFKRKYIGFMTVETIVSLICFVLVTYINFDNLPGYYEKTVWYSEQGYNIVYLTPYYTMGWLSTHGYFGRNAGMFWEPGAHAIYINIAILFIFSGALDDIKPKKRNIVLWILTFGSLSTLSTTGYITLVLCFVFWMFWNPNKWNACRKIFIIGASILIIVFAALVSGALDKLIYRSGSYVTRMNDTVSGASVAFQNWFMGKGIFVDISDVLKSVGIGNMSNGMVYMLIRLGIPLFIVYLILMHFGLKRLFRASGIALCCVDLIFFLFMNLESLYSFPIFISLLFFWKDDCTFTKKSRPC